MDFAKSILDFFKCNSLFVFDLIKPVTIMPDGGIASVFAIRTKGNERMRTTPLKLLPSPVQKFNLISRCCAFDPLRLNICKARKLRTFLHPVSLHFVYCSDTARGRTPLVSLSSQADFSDSSFVWLRKRNTHTSVATFFTIYFTLIWYDWCFIFLFLYFCFKVLYWWRALDVLAE